jgi:hypothetical protein
VENGVRNAENINLSRLVTFEKKQVSAFKSGDDFHDTTPNKQGNHGIGVWPCEK